MIAYPDDESSPRCSDLPSDRALPRNDRRRARGRRSIRWTPIGAILPAMRRASRRAGGRRSMPRRTICGPISQLWRQRGSRLPPPRANSPRSGSSTGFSWPRPSAPTIPRRSWKARARGQRLPKILSVKEVDRLLAVAKEGLDSETRPAGERLRAARMNALLELLYATGLRVSELVSLPRHALRGRDPLIAIKGKGGRERLVVVSEPARAAVELFRAMLKQRHPRRDRGGPGCFRPIATAAISPARLSPAI